MNWVRDNLAWVIAGIAAVELLVIVWLGIRVADLGARLEAAVEAAEDAAKAAALAAPGGIDPEVVLNMLRAGHPTSLDSVHAVMEQQQQGGDQPL